MSKNLYIVPHDLTEVGDAALKYAIHLGNRIETEIRILHIVSDRSKAAAASAKIDEHVGQFDIPDHVEITKVIKEGSIFEDIAKISKVNSAQLIIMGTHGEKGLQKLFGSHAMKVVTSTEIPFMVVQRNTDPRQVKSIVVPIDLAKESLQIIKPVGDLAHIYGAEVHVLGEKQKDELLSQQMKNRIQIVKQQFDERNIECKVDFFNEGGSYSKKVIDYSKANKIDMIAVAYHTEAIIASFDKFVQNLITNPLDIPCMVINSKTVSQFYY